ncbi:MFS domain-containing protein [Fusarium falciforme]|uniref:MFS domain-containing protein n=1 Tax=Fusarium falciforme TaxID=195108 RepID=UPI0023007DC4|nr:MFS domain-containing protein [Fusarium falciforme]WAO92417.1 MFS domain-containing protein [Fusarium falciforme]
MASNLEKTQGDIAPAIAPIAVDVSVAHEAAAAAEAERGMGLLASLKLYKKACFWSVFISICIVMEGFDNALLNNLYAYPPFQRKFGVQQPDGSYQLTAAWQSGLSNGTLCGQILGLFFNGIIADRFGYRKTLIGALIGCIAFIFIIFFSETLIQLLIGEILIGIPWGVFQTLTTTYAAEVCPTHLRAYLTTYVNLCWVMGQFIASGVLRAMLSRDDKWGYKIPFALQWMWPVPLIIGIWLAPESPWWLVRRGRIEEAKHSLQRLTVRNENADFKPDETISMMIHTNEMEKEAQAGTTYLDLFKGVSLRRTEIVCVTWMIQTLCGSTFMGYSTYFYQQAGMAIENSFSMSLGQYAIGAVGTVFSWFLMGWFGRRTLYLYGQLFMSLFLLTIGCVAFAGRENVAAQWAIGSLLLVYTFTYDCTVGPVCYSLVAELTSTRLRTKSVVLARNLYNISGIATNIITPRMLNPSAWNWGAKAGFFWAGTCLVCAVWTYFRLPEPKGRTYAELDILFERHISARKFKETTVERLDAGFEEKAGAFYIEKKESN